MSLAIDREVIEIPKAKNANCSIVICISGPIYVVHKMEWPLHNLELHSMTIHARSSNLSPPKVPDKQFWVFALNWLPFVAILYDILSSNN